MADHHHLDGAVGIDVVEEHERGIEVAGQELADAEKRSIEAVLEAHEPEMPPVQFRRSLPARGAGHLRPRDARKQFPVPDVSSKIILVLPEAGRASRSSIDHERLDPAADRRREDDAPAAVAGIIADVDDQRPEIALELPDLLPCRSPAFDRVVAQYQDVLLAVPRHVANQDRFGGDAWPSQINRPRNARRPPEPPLERRDSREAPESCRYVGQSPPVPPSAQNATAGVTNPSAAKATVKKTRRAPRWPFSDCSSCRPPSILCIASRAKRSYRLIRFLRSCRDRTAVRAGRKQDPRRLSSAKFVSFAPGPRSGAPVRPKAPGHTTKVQWHRRFTPVG